MRRIEMSMALLALVGGAVGCRSELTVPDLAAGGAGRDVESPGEQADTATIGLGETVTFSDLGAALTYVALESDSRCPTGVTCVWAGDAQVRLRLVRGGESTEVLLHTALDPGAVVVGDVEVELVDVLPYPVYEDPTDPADTAVLVRVERVST